MKRRRAALTLLATCFAALTLALSTASAQRATPSREAPLSRPTMHSSKSCRSGRSCSSGSRRTRRPASSATGRGPTGRRARARREIGSIASVGFGLSGMCIAAERGWLPREQGRAGAHDAPFLPEE